MIRAPRSLRRWSCALPLRRWPCVVAQQRPTQSRKPASSTRSSSATRNSKAARERAAQVGRDRGRAQARDRADRRRPPQAQPGPDRHRRPPARRRRPRSRRPKRGSSRSTTTSARIRKSLDGRRAVIGEVLAALQRIGHRPPPALIASPEDALQSVRTAMMLGAVLPEMRHAGRGAGQRPRRTAARPQGDRRRTRPAQQPRSPRSATSARA